MTFLEVEKSSPRALFRSNFLMKYSLGGTTSMFSQTKTQEIQTTWSCFLNVNSTRFSKIWFCKILSTNLLSLHDIVNARLIFFLKIKSLWKLCDIFSKSWIWDWLGTSLSWSVIMIQPLLYVKTPRKVFISVLPSKLSYRKLRRCFFLSTNGIQILQYQIIFPFKFSLI